MPAIIYYSVWLQNDNCTETGKCTSVCLNLMKVRCEPKFHIFDMCYLFLKNCLFKRIWSLLSWIFALMGSLDLIHTRETRHLYMRIFLARIRHMNICFFPALQSFLMSSHVLSKSLLTQSAWWGFYDTGLYLKVNLGTNWPRCQSSKRIH